MLANTTTATHDLKTALIGLANAVRNAVLPELEKNKKEIVRRLDGGDPHFAIDELAEQTVQNIIKKWNIPAAYFSEDRGLILLHKSPQWILIIDPIDGTRPAMANFESCCFSAAVAPYSKNPTFKDISHAIVLEIKSGNYIYADLFESSITTNGFSIAKSNKDINTRNMFWSTELTAHPIKQITRVCGNLIDNSVLHGAIFVFTSSSFSLSRIISGQLDAHVDVGHRIVTDNPTTRTEFEKVGGGKIVTLYPYDIAAAAFILKKAGGIVTDAYGKSLDTVSLLTDKSLQQQCSIIAASTQELHNEIQRQLTW